MRFIVAADTDVGIVKNTNQDSLLIKHALYDGGEVLMAVVCDGMGGLSHGEVASATVIKSFDKWFREELPSELEEPNMDVIAHKWSLMLKTLNMKLAQYGEAAKSSLGTTFTGMLLLNDKYIVVHVGDTRVYSINDREINQITSDQTFVAREIARGNMTVEEAKHDRRRNILLQCIGASKTVEPEIIKGNVQSGVYMLCSDGFRHKISSEEIHSSFKPSAIRTKEDIKHNARGLIEKIKARDERDNISVIVVKVG